MDNIGFSFFKYSGNIYSAYSAVETFIFYGGTLWTTITRL